MYIDASRVGIPEVLDFGTYVPQPASVIARPKSSAKIARSTVYLDEVATAAVISNNRSALLLTANIRFHLLLDPVLYTLVLPGSNNTSEIVLPR